MFKSRIIYKQALHKVQNSLELIFAICATHEEIRVILKSYISCYMKTFTVYRLILKSKLNGKLHGSALCSFEVITVEKWQQC